MSEDFDAIVIGGGPAGLTAGIYASRAGLNCVMIDEGAGGGLAATSPWIENYPGFKGVSGFDLMMTMKEHAEEHVRVDAGVHVESVRESDGRYDLRAGKREYSGDAVILATGARYKQLGIPGEVELAGRGVSYCATCDGMFFKGKKVAVVGGGNNAAVEAIHLKNIGADVWLIHRRDKLRAEKSLQEQMEKDTVNVILNTELRRIEGGEKVERLIIFNNLTEQEQELPVQGVFVAVGEVPNTTLAKQLGVLLAANGYIDVDRAQRTSVPRVYAAGDVTGGLRQVITACAEGAIAATSAFEDIRTPYWTNKDGQP